MKKSLFFVAAASALMLTACSSENEATQSAPQLQSGPQAVAFDTYMPQVAKFTRAGSPEGVMTTDKLKTENTGFGVFSFYHNVTESTGYPLNNTSEFPNFMYNEHVSWTPAGGWAYPILKYWPNETKNDSQNPNATVPSNRIDKLSFFAYAPYVSTGTGGELDQDGTMTGVSKDGYVSSPAQGYGIVSVIKPEVKNDPLVEWKARFTTTTPSTWPDEILDHNVDLLWGVAPAGMDYTAVNGENVKTTFGKPLVDLVKPDKDQKIKFLFQHALSRIGLSVVSAIDQIAAGDDGGKFDNAQTRVLIDNVKVWGNFGVQGILNLNNTKENVAEWSNITLADNNADHPILNVNATNGYLAPELRYDASKISEITGSIGDATDGDINEFNNLNEGVLPSEKNLLAGGPDPGRQITSTAAIPYAKGTVLYQKEALTNDYKAICVAPTSDVNVFVADGNNWKQIGKTGANTVMDGSKNYYNINATPVAAAGTATIGTKYYTKTGNEASGNAVYTLRITGETGLEPITTADYTIAEGEPLAGSPYPAGTYYKGLAPRYFMVVPTALTPAGTKTSVSVQITYHVVTKDGKLADFISNVENVITKTADFQFESGKSYNLKLILGLTSVKLDAVVGEWQVGDDAEVWLPQNVE